MRYRWRIACPGTPPWRQAPREVSRLADATAAAESFLLVGSDMGDVVVVFRDQPGKEPEWAPQVVGVRSGGSVTWHPWPPGWLRGTELAPLAKTGAALEPAAGRDGTGGVIAGERGGSIVTVSVDPGKPSMVAKVAAQNAGLYEAEAAGQAIPGEEIDAIPLAAAPPPAVIEAPLAGAAQPPQDQASAS
jgi:hypothetical protein